MWCHNFSCADRDENDPYLQQCWFSLNIMDDLNFRWTVRHADRCKQWHYPFGETNWGIKMMSERNIHLKKTDVYQGKHFNAPTCGSGNIFMMCLPIVWNNIRNIQVQTNVWKEDAGTFTCWLSDKKWTIWFMQHVYVHPCTQCDQDSQLNMPMVWFGFVSFLLYKLLTHWGRDKMAAISQTTFSYALIWIIMYEFWLRFHWGLFLRVQLIIFQHWFR